MVKAYDVTDWTTTNYNTHTTQYLFLKNHAENEIETLVPDLFWFFKKALYEVEAST